MLAIWFRVFHAGYMNMQDGGQHPDLYPSDPDVQAFLVAEQAEAYLATPHAQKYGATMIREEQRSARKELICQRAAEWLTYERIEQVLVALTTRARPI